MKAIIIILIIAIVGGLFFVGDRVLLSQHKSPIKSPKVLTKTVTLNQNINPSSLYPSTPLNCSTNVSLIQLTTDYIVTNMPCNSPKVNANTTFMSCNGSILQSATNVSLDCYRLNYYASSDLLYCSGTTNAASAPSNLLLNYSCSLPYYSGNNSIYTCSGDIAGYSSLAISLPMSVSCS